MMEIDSFVSNFSNLGFNPYIVINGNQPIPIEIDEKDLQILDIRHPEVNKYLKGLNTQKHNWRKYSGYFIRSPKGSSNSIQTCFLTSENGLKQRVHNILFAEEDSTLEIFTGCLSNSHVKDNTHTAIMDIFVGKNAKVTFNMIHSWGENSKVYPHTKVYVQEGGEYISNYIVWDKVKEIVANPKIILGEKAKATVQSLSYIHPNSNIDLGGTVILKGKDSSGEILSSVVSNGGKFITKTDIQGKGSNSKGHISCDALLLNDKSRVTAIPKLFSQNKDSQLTHEAYLGKISSEEIEYLQTKGLGEKKAEEIIVRGFANKSIEKMPDVIKEKMRLIIEESSKGF